MTEQEWLASEDPEALLQHYCYVTDGISRTLTIGDVETAIGLHRLRLICQAVGRDDGNWWEANYPDDPGLWLHGWLSGIAEQRKELQEFRRLCHILRDIVGNPFKPWSTIRTPNGVPIRTTASWTQRYNTLALSWLTSTVKQLAQAMYDTGDFTAMPILGDALEEAGCENEAILGHCRQAKCELDTDGDGNCPAHKAGCPAHLHVRGCWVVDLILGHE